MTVVASGKLSARDLDIIGRARELAEVNDAGDLAAAFGRAQYLLGQLADLAERLAD